MYIHMYMYIHKNDALSYTLYVLDEWDRNWNTEPLHCLETISCTTPCDY